MYTVNEDNNKKVSETEKKYINRDSDPLRCQKAWNKREYTFCTHRIRAYVVFDIDKTA